MSALAQRSIGFQLSAVVAPAVGGLLFAIQAELVYAVAIGSRSWRSGASWRSAAGRCRRPKGAVGLERGARRRPAHPRTNVLLGAISLDLFAVLLGGAVALLPIFAKDILEVGPTGSRLPPAAPASARSRGAVIARGRSGAAPGRCSSPSSPASASRWSRSASRRQMWLSMLALALGAGLDMVSVVLR